MNWQKRFDESYTQCAVVADKIFPLTAEFEKLEKEHGLFTDVFRASAKTEDAAKKHKVMKWQFYIGFPIIFVVFGAAIGLIIYNVIHNDATITELFNYNEDTWRYIGCCRYSSHRICSSS